MKSIEEMAQKYSEIMLEKEDVDFDKLGEMAKYCFELAEAMQAEAEKRKTKDKWQSEWDKYQAAYAWVQKLGGIDEAKQTVIVLESGFTAAPATELRDAIALVEEMEILKLNNSKP